MVWQVLLGAPLALSFVVVILKICEHKRDYQSKDPKKRRLSWLIVYLSLAACILSIVCFYLNRNAARELKNQVATLEETGSIIDSIDVQIVIDADSPESIPLVTPSEIGPGNVIGLATASEEYRFCTGQPWFKACQSQGKKQILIEYSEDTSPLRGQHVSVLENISTLRYELSQLAGKQFFKGSDEVRFRFRVLINGLLVVHQGRVTRWETVTKEGLTELDVRAAFSGISDKYRKLRREAAAMDIAGASITSNSIAAVL